MVKRNANSIKMGVCFALMIILCFILFKAGSKVSRLSSNEIYFEEIPKGSQYRTHQTETLIPSNDQFDSIIILASAKRMKQNSYLWLKLDYNFSFIEYGQNSTLSNVTILNNKKILTFDSDALSSNSINIITKDLEKSNFSVFRFVYELNPSHITGIDFMCRLYDKQTKRYAQFFRIFFFVSSLFTLISFPKFSIWNKLLCITLILSANPYPTLRSSKIDRALLSIFFSYYRFDYFRVCFKYTFQRIQDMFLVFMFIYFCMEAAIAYNYFSSGDHLYFYYPTIQYGDYPFFMQVFYAMNYLCLIFFSILAYFTLTMRYNPVLMCKTLVFSVFLGCAAINAIVQMTGNFIRGYILNPIHFDFLFISSCYISAITYLLISKEDKKQDNQNQNSTKKGEKFTIKRTIKSFTHFVNNFWAGK